MSETRKMTQAEADALTREEVDQLNADGVVLEIVKNDAVEDLEEALDKAEIEIAEAEVAEEIASDERAEADAAEDQAAVEQAEAEAALAEAKAAAAKATAELEAAEAAVPKKVRFCANPGYSLVRGEEEIKFPFETDDQELIEKIMNGRGVRANEVWVDDRTHEESAAEEAALSKLGHDKLARMVNAMGYRDTNRFSKHELIDILAKGGLGG